MLQILTEQMRFRVNVLRKIKENLIKNWDVKKSPDDRTFQKEIKSYLNYKRCLSNKIKLLEKDKILNKDNGIIEEVL